MRLTLFGLCLLAAAHAVSGQQPAQTPQPPTFRLETNLIEVDAVVTDAAGNIVRGLTKDDFTILDDGKPQPIAAFAFFDIPVERDEAPRPAGLLSPAGLVAPRVEPDVATNELFDGRVYVLVLDDLHTTPEWSQQVRRTARLFLDRNLGDNDLMAVIYASRGNAGSGFTSNRSVLSAAIGEFTGTRPMTPQLEGEARGIGGRLRPTLRMERESNAARMLGLIQRISNWADQTLPGRRKALLLFSEGVEGFTAGDFEGGDLATGGQAEFRQQALESRIGQQVKAAIAAAARGNVSIFPVDARGLDNISVTNGHLFLSAMANETGGTPVLRMNDFAVGFDRIVRNASSYYALAYAPPDARRGSYHNITVTVNRPGLQVRARRGYQTPDNRPRTTLAATERLRVDAVSPQLSAALNSPVPASDLRVTVFTVPFKGEGKNVSVLIGTELGNLALGEPDESGHARDEVELTSVVTALRETKSSRTDRLRLSFTPQAIQRTGGGAVRVLYRLDVQPGKYQLRVAARDGNSGRVGAVLHDLQVPDLTNVKSALAMSGLVLTSARAIEMPTTGDEERVTLVVGTPPAARRQFSPDDEIAVFAEIYDTDKASHVDVVATRIVAATGETALETVETIPDIGLRAAGGVYEHQASLRLDDLEAGRYVLRVEVRSQRSPDRIVSREVPFSITR